MPPLVIVALGALGVAAIARVVVSESRRINEALDRHRNGGAAPAPEPEAIRLERDPVTGEYRPRQH